MHLRHTMSLSQKAEVMKNKVLQEKIERFEKSYNKLVISLGGRPIEKEPEPRLINAYAAAVVGVITYCLFLPLYYAQQSYNVEYKYIKQDETN